MRTEVHFLKPIYSSMYNPAISILVAGFCSKSNCALVQQLINS